MYKVAILGDRDSIYGFATLGLQTFPVEDPQEAAAKLRELASNDYAIIYITETIMAQISEEIERYKEDKIPAIIPIPGVAERNGAAMDNLQKLVIQAVGSDIFNNEN